MPEASSLLLEPDAGPGMLSRIGSGISRLFSGPEQEGAGQYGNVPAEPVPGTAPGVHPASSRMGPAAAQRTVPGLPLEPAEPTLDIMSRMEGFTGGDAQAWQSNPQAIAMIARINESDLPEDEKQRRITGVKQEAERLASGGR